MVANLSQRSPDRSQVPPIPTDIVESRIHRRLGELIDLLVQEGEIRSERELGRRAKISHGSLRNWSTLTSDPQLLKLIKFAYTIGWSMSELMNFAEGDEDAREAILRKRREREKRQSSDQPN
jgi:hypothetical protein